MLEQLIENIDENTIVITATSRLAAKLKTELLKKSQSSTSNISFSSNSLNLPKYKIYSLDAWLKRYWQQLKISLHSQTLPTLVSDNVALILLESIVKSNDFLQPLAATKLMYTAVKLSKDWLLDNKLSLKAISDSHTDYMYTAEVKTFINCKEELYNLLAANNYCIKSDVIHFITQAIFNKEIDISGNVIFYGFDDINPALEQLIKSLKNAGVKSSILTNTVNENKSFTRFKKMHFNTVDEELEYIANWAYSEVYLNKDKARDNTSIAVVIPNLSRIRDKVENIFLSVFDKEIHSLPYAKVSSKFNISAGKSLHEYSVINITSYILKLMHDKISLDDLLFVIKNPYILNSNTHFHARANICYEFSKKVKRNHLTLTEVVEFLRRMVEAKDVKIDADRGVEESKRESGDNDVNFVVAGNELIYIFLTIEKLKLELQELASKDSDKLSFKQSAYYILSCLKIVGWPGERYLNSIEYQAVKRLQELLEEYKGLDLTNRKFKFNSAINKFNQLCFDTVFQPQTEYAPVQILGVLEAASSPFDKVWFAGLTNEVWPNIPSPNPFLPQDLQKKLSMPHATAARELEFSNSIMQSFISNSREFITSWHITSQEKTLEQSPLIKNYTLCEDLNNNVFESATESKNDLCKEIKVESLIDDYGPKVKEEKLKGGVQIFNMQAACPFKAFAKHRLNAREVPTLNKDFSLIDRGILVHAILERFWVQIKTQENLLAMDVNSLKARVGSIVARVVDVYLLKNNIPSKQFWNLEKLRLKHLILSWLELEKTRPKFSVLATESLQQINVGKFVIDIRVDRIDKVTTSKGEEFVSVIDYKTGKLALNSIKLEPDDLQLPLYCMSKNTDANAVILGQVRANNCLFIGVSSLDTQIEGVKTSDQLGLQWQELLDAWYTIITKVEDEFANGLASVRPKNTTVCRYCDLQGLCRINERLE